MSYLYKIISTKLPTYFHELIPPLQRSHQYPGCFQTLHCRTTFFPNSFLPLTITEQNKLDYDIKNIDSHAMFCKKLLSFIRPLENDTYRIYDPLGVRSLSRLRSGFSQLKLHKFRYNFPDTLNPLCLCSLETEGTEYYFLRCQNNISFRINVINVNTAIASLNSNDFPRVVLYGDKSFNKETN